MPTDRISLLLAGKQKGIITVRLQQHCEGSTENPKVDFCFSSFALLYNKILNNPRFNITQHTLPDSKTMLISGYKLHEY